MKILIVQNKMGIGDMVIYLPFINAISKKFNTPVNILVKESSKAEKILKKRNIFPKIINMSSLNKFNILWLKRIVKNYKYIFSIDDHSKVGGMGDNLLSNLNENNLIKDKFFYKLGVKNFPECGTSDEVLKFHKLDFKSLSNKIINKINK